MSLWLLLIGCFSRRVPSAASDSRYVTCVVIANRCASHSAGAEESFSFHERSRQAESTAVATSLTMR